MDLFAQMQVRLINVDMAQCQRHDQSAASWLIVYANGMQLCQSPAVPGTTSQHHTLPVVEGWYTRSMKRVLLNLINSQTLTARQMHFVLGLLGLQTLLTHDPPRSRLS